MTLTAPKTLSISIIIPVHNEEAAIGRCLDGLPRTAGLEILVVDGGSMDRTVSEVEQRGHRCLASPPGRGRQQHEGALAARGDNLLFLHCDTLLPENFLSLVDTTLAQKGVAAGAFELGIEAPGGAFRIIEHAANLRSRLLQLPYGDQGLFMSRSTYHAVGGFPDQPLLEDVVLVQKLRNHGKIMIVPAKVQTSARRWRDMGILKTTLLNQLILAGWRVGLSPHRLAAWYYGSKESAAGKKYRP
jgi:rSAM/selenodomain-associated transferase 2